LKHHLGAKRVIERIRAGRSVRLQMMAAWLVTSSLATPYGISGRMLSGVTSAGALL
jgi:hypothetical protein